MTTQTTRSIVYLDLDHLLQVFSVFGPHLPKFTLLKEDTNPMMSRAKTILVRFLILYTDGLAYGRFEHLIVNFTSSYLTIQYLFYSFLAFESLKRGKTIHLLLGPE